MTVLGVGAPPLIAHGIGGRQDLPVPLGVSVAAAVVVLIVSFVALAILWKEPRWQAPIDGPVFAERPVGVLRPLLAVVGVLALALVIVAGFVGIDNPASNPGPVLVFVVFWLVVPFLAAAVVDLYPLLDPWRRLGTWFGFAPEDEPAIDRLGYLPATFAFMGFTWLELLSPWTGPRAIGIAAVAYTVYLLSMGWRFGQVTAGETSDAFAVYNRFLGAMAPYRLEAGGLVRQGWLRGLVRLPERRWIDVFVVAMIGTVTYDGASATPWWEENLELPIVTWLADLGMSIPTAAALAGTVWWALIVILVYGAYVAASWAATRLAGSTQSVSSVARRFAHTLVPIAFAYAFAHYFTLVLFEGQLLLSTMSDPFGLGWDLFGTAGRSIDYGLIAESTAWVWYVQVAAIVLGHVGGVILAHDRALGDFEADRAVASQYAMLGLMVVLTGVGLVILAAG